MSYSRYLESINNSLRQYVLPDLASDRARDSLTLSMSAIAAICAGLDRVPPDVLHGIDAKTLPPELRTLAATLAETTVRQAPGPADDLAFREEARPLLDAGARWLATAPWGSDAGLHEAAGSLLAWESALRAWTLERARAADAATTKAGGAAQVPDISRDGVERYLQKRLASNQLRVTGFKFLSGGRNRQTALFSIEGTTEIPSELVLQRESPATITTLSGAGMQFRVLERAFAAGMKVAQPVMLELSPEALGAPFMITRQVHGASPMESMDYWGKPPTSDKMAASLAAQFALMHRIPISSLEGVMARYVDVSAGQSWLGDIDALEQEWERMAHSPSMAVSAAIAWLRAHVGCVDATEAVVHNDALLHNVLVDQDEITAVLDWEMAHIGHPIEDLGYVRPVVEKMTDWHRFVDAYVAAGGIRPTQEQVDFFTLRSILKLLIQVLYARGAFEGGHADNLALAEVGAAFLPRLIDRLAAQLNGIVRSHPAS